MDVLDCNWGELAEEKGGKLSLIGNLPYHITTEILFSLADHCNAIDRAVFTTQLEVSKIYLL